MRATTNKATSVPLPPNLLTVPEAAWVADTEVRVVEGELDKKIVVTQAKGRRLLDRSDASYLYAVRELHRSIERKLRRHIYEQVRLAVQRPSQRKILLGSFVLSLGPILAKVDQRIKDVREARASVTRDPRIRSGEPVVQGTRIPVRMLSEMVRNGASKDELAEGYNLSTRQIELALLFDQLHPRRGRPTQSNAESWSDLGDIDRIDVEELGEYHKP